MVYTGNGAARHSAGRRRIGSAMFNVLMIAAAVFIWLAIVSGYLRFDREKLVEQVTRLAGGALVVVAVFLALIGRELAAAATAVVGLTIMGAATDAVANVGYVFGRRLRGILGLFGMSGLVGGARAVLRTGYLEVEVDKSSGAIRGRVLKGTYAGHVLDRMAMTELAYLRRELARDPDSQSLLEAYLDRRQPRWREDLKFDAQAGRQRSPGSSAMTHEEAHKVLGLEPGAGDAEVREAHRRLMKALHPDVGGSAFLAAKINEAKDILIGKHGTRSTH
jgi:hypothetical protein